MRGIFTLVGAAIVLFGGLGWYLGWYKIETTVAPNGHREVNVDLNTNKIKNDIQQGEKKLEAAINKNAPTQTPNNGQGFSVNLPNFTQNPDQNQGFQIPPPPQVPTGFNIQTPVGNGNVTLPPLPNFDQR